MYSMLVALVTARLAYLCIGSGLLHSRIRADISTLPPRGQGTLRVPGTVHSPSSYSSTPDPCSRVTSTVHDSVQRLDAVSGDFLGSLDQSTFCIHTILLSSRDYLRSTYYHFSDENSSAAATSRRWMPGSCAEWPASSTIVRRRLSPHAFLRSHAERA